MDAPELKVYRVMAAFLAWITLWAWAWCADACPITYHAYYALVGLALVIALFSKIDAYRSENHLILGSFYLAAFVATVAISLHEVATIGYDSGSIGLKVLTAGLLAILARAAFLADVKADV